MKELQGVNEEDLLSDYLLGQRKHDYEARNQQDRTEPASSGRQGPSPPWGLGCETPLQEARHTAQQTATPTPGKGCAPAASHLPQVHALWQRGGTHSPTWFRSF